MPIQFVICLFQKSILQVECLLVRERFWVGGGSRFQYLVPITVNYITTLKIVNTTESSVVWYKKIFNISTRVINTSTDAEQCWSNFCLALENLLF